MIAADGRRAVANSVGRDGRTSSGAHMAQIGEDRLLAVAAGVVFYGLLALFPAVTAFVSLYGLFAKASTINEHLSLVSGLMPGGGVEIIQEQVNRIAAKGEAKLGFAFAFGLALALWSANAGMKALIDALNVIYDEKEKRGFIKLNFVSLILTAGGLLAILTAVGAIVVLPVVLSYVGLGGWTEMLLRLLRWPVLLFVVIFGLAVLYRFGPSREHPRWEWLSVGSVAGRGRVACKLGVAVVVPGELRQLRCDLWLAGRRHRHDDVDVGVLHRHPGRRRTQFRGRASDRPRLHDRLRTAARPTRGGDGGHGWSGRIMKVSFSDFPTASPSGPAGDIMEERMDADADTNLIASELMAVQGILMCVLRRVAAIDQNLASAIESGLDDATNLAEEMKVALGEEATSGEAAEALRTIERLRAGILGANPGGTD